MMGYGFYTNINMRFRSFEDCSVCASGVQDGSSILSLQSILQGTDEIALPQSRYSGPQKRSD